jgi:hypothetical protein
MEEMLECRSGNLLSIDKLRSVEEFKHYSDEDANKLIQLMQRLAHVLLPEQASASSQNEQKLLDVVRSGEYDEIIVVFRDKKMHSLTLNKAQDTKRKIVDVLRENPFQEITIKSHRGKVIRFLSKLKIKFGV